MFHQHASLAVFALFMQAQLFNGVKGVRFNSDFFPRLLMYLGVQLVPATLRFATPWIVLKYVMK